MNTNTNTSQTYNYIYKFTNTNIDRSVAQLGAQVPAADPRKAGLCQCHRHPGGSWWSHWTSSLLSAPIIIWRSPSSSSWSSPRPSWWPPWPRSYSLALVVSYYFILLQLQLLLSMHCYFANSIYKINAVLLSLWLFNYRSPLPRGKRLQRDQDRQGGVLREDSEQVWKEVDICCCRWDQTTLFVKSTLFVEMTLFVNIT